MQNRKLKFLTTNRFLGLLFLLLFQSALSMNIHAQQSWSGPTKKQTSEMKYFLHTGFTFDSVLRTSIFSFNIITPVIAETESDVMFLGKVMLPKGTKIIGSASITKSADRVNVSFQTIVFPDGQEIQFNGMALHTDGSAGLPGKVKRQRAVLPATILLGSVGTAVSAATGQPLASQLATGIAEQTKSELAEKQTYSIEVKKDVPLQVYVVSRIEY